MSEPPHASPSRPASSPWTWSVGHLLGIPIRIHASFLLLLVWFGTISAQQPGGVLGGVIFLLLLFGCVVLHELGHATMARRFGVETRDIVLYPIGGIARVDRIPAGKAELWIALAGPAVNLVLAAMIFGAATAIGIQPPSTADDLVAGSPVVWQLIAVNLSLLLFNLLPAFPMDGGRVLRAALSIRLGQERATRIAARVGQVIAALLAVAALVSTPANPVLLLIAIFVFVGAGQEVAYERGRAAVQGLDARAAMVTHFETLAPNDTLGRAADLLLATHQHDFPVIDAWGRVAGVLRRSTLLEALAAGGRDAAVLEVMDREPLALAPQTPLVDVLNLLQGRPKLPILVIGAQGLEGMITLENFGELIEVARRLGPALAGRRHG